MAHKIVYSAEGLDPREAFDDWFARVCLVKDSPTAFILVNLEKGEGRVPGLLARGRSLLISTVYPAVQEVGEPLYGLLAVGRALISAVAPIFAWRSACTSAWF